MTAGRGPLRVFAPAKINWYLAIERRRPDGYHDILTVFQTLAWGDELRLRATGEDACRIRCNDPAVPTGDENLVARAWRRLREAMPDRVGGVDVELVKRIPAGAGLGGRDVGQFEVVGCPEVGGDDCAHEVLLNKVDLVVRLLPVKHNRTCRSTLVVLLV